MFRLRRRYRIVLEGSQISIPVEDDSRPIVGFTAVRFVRAFSPEEAAAVAIARLRGAWFNSPYSVVDRSGGPIISVREVERVRNPFRRSRPNRGYRFYQEREGDGAEAEGRGREPAGVPVAG